MQAAFCASQQVDPGEFEKFGLDLRGRAALQHLLEVAAGLNSQMLGETEIFGQVKEAYAAAQSRRSAGRNCSLRVMRKSAPTLIMFAIRCKAQQFMSPAGRTGLGN